VAGVVDAVVVGIPNERFGEEIVAVVQLAPGVEESSVAPDTVIEHVKARLASYKAPRRVHFVETVGRSPSGKVDYARHRTETADWLGVPMDA
jgi:fatty-acyl-CoA synthase